MPVHSKFKVHKLYIKRKMTQSAAFVKLRAISNGSPCAVTLQTMLYDENKVSNNYHLWVREPITIGISSEDSFEDAFKKLEVEIAALKKST